MRHSAKALTVDQVTQVVAKRIKGEIRSILNAMDKNDELKSVHGGGPYSTHYHTLPMRRL
jgi:hypothetical protein